MDVATLHPHETTPIEVVRRRGQLDRVDDRRLRRMLETREWVRIVPGVFARAVDWRALKPIERHRAKVLETLHRMTAPAVVSHRSVAAAWGIDTLGAWPRHVEITTERASGGRTSGLVRRYGLGLSDVERMPFAGRHVTVPAQTALDLARSLPFAEAVAAVDQAIWQGRDGGPLTTLGEVEDLLELAEPRRGDVRARRVLEFASPLAANVRESQMRVLVVALGFSTPRPQERRVLPSGRVAYGDLYFPEDDHWLEVDGRGKYLSPEFGLERDPAMIVIDEKNRENEIRREVRGFSRLEATDADNPRLVYDVLTRDGLRSRLPRP
ncbi:MAG: hypothetical protein QM611_09150 [Microbacterium sp.]|uniref:hypothetical protein n=1 Tax=Microbacterium sp. TaxID=51671 RepID=UPI0039E585B8